MDNISLDTLELEKNVQDNWEKELKRLELLSKSVQSLHVKCLYSQEHEAVSKVAKDVWTVMIKKVGASFGHWRELGIFLGLSADDLDYIEYSVNADKTDTVLRVYMQNDNATLNKVTDALVKMKRYDILKAIEVPLLQMNQFLKQTHNSDTGYASYSENIITPSDVENRLPEVLRSTNSCSLQPQINSSSSMSKTINSISTLDENKVIIFLTFVKDGKRAAEKILRDWQDNIEVDLVTLDSRRDEVMTNPEMIIQSFIQKADYIVPVATEGYMSAISLIHQDSSETNLDYKYAGFVFRQLSHNFSMIDNCWNNKVRCFIPSDEDSEITMKVRRHQVLVPWIWDADFDAIFKVLIENAMSNKNK